MIRVYDALIAVTYWIGNGIEQVQDVLSDRRNAIALRRWDAEQNASAREADHD